MARLGAIIVCIDINETANNETVRMVQDEGNVAFGFQCDVSDNAQVQAVSAQGGVDAAILIFHNFVRCKQGRRAQPLRLHSLCAQCHLIIQDIFFHFVQPSGQKLMRESQDWLHRKQITSEVGDATIVFNNAGVRLVRPFAQYTQAQIEQMITVNLMGQVRGTSMHSVA